MRGDDPYCWLLTMTKVERCHMKALSVDPLMGVAIVFGDKTIECRSWDTKIRGDLLICTTKRREIAGISGHAVAIVRIANTRPFTKDDLENACMWEMPEKNSFAWELEDVRLIEPFEVKGKQHIYNVDDSKIKILSDGIDVSILNDVYKPLVYFGGDKEAELMWDFS